MTLKSVDEKEPPDPFLCPGCVDGSCFLETPDSAISVEFLKLQLSEAHSELRFRKAQARVGRELAARTGFEKAVLLLEELAERFETMASSVMKDTIGKAANRAAALVVRNFIARAEEEAKKIFDSSGSVNAKR